LYFSQATYTIILMKTIFLFIVAILTFSCKPTETAMSREARAYIDEVVNIMQQHSVKKNTINWKDFRQKVYKRAGHALTVADTYPAIHYAITLLGDSHSYFAPVSGEDEEAGSPPVLPDAEVPNGVGYVRVRYCMGSEGMKHTYIQEITDKIKSRDREDLKGWVVDLRGNFGGDMAPMLLGLMPVLGEGTLGYAAYPDGKMAEWQYAAGKLSFGNDTVVNTAVYRLKKQNPYVAVLTDTLTASSGEAVAVAFKGRARTRSFGKPTYGVSTSNQGFTLSDGSRMLLTVAVFADRDKKKYGVPVLPDVDVSPDVALQHAIGWLQEVNRQN
jgi:carboxyl-terminal processing protease